jgi:hypothetical protein
MGRGRKKHIQKMKNRKRQIKKKQRLQHKKSLA